MMVTDAETDFLFVADTLPKKHPQFFNEFSKILNDESIMFSLLPNTKDIWAVDFMPIQIQKDRFIQFTYCPDYLRKYKRWSKTISDVNCICKEIGLSPVKSDIVLDGGNVVREKNKVIMCDKIFVENPGYEKKFLTNELKELFEVDHLFFIPTHPKDMIGHADGMVRFLNDQTVIINNYKNEKKEFKKAFQNALHDAGLDTVEIPYIVDSNKNEIQANGIYLNYLQMRNLIVVPTFGIAEDEEALKIFEQLFPSSAINLVDSNEIAKEGGVLNCISWNIIR